MSCYTLCLSKSDTYASRWYNIVEWVVCTSATQRAPYPDVNITTAATVDSLLRRHSQMHSGDMYESLGSSLIVISVISKSLVCARKSMHIRTINKFTNSCIKGYFWMLSPLIK